MEAYIELVILDNFMMDALILLISANILKFRINKLRIAAAAGLGTAGAVLAPLIPYAAAMIIRFALVPLMSAAAVKYRSIRQFILFCLTVLAITFGIGGTVIAVFNMSARDGLAYMTYASGGVLGLSAFAVMFIFYAFKQIILRYKVKIGSDTLYKARLETRAGQKVCAAFCDNGNSLTDKEGKPVLVASRAMKEWLQSGCPRGSPLKVRTISGESVKTPYILDKVLIYKGHNVNTLYNIGCVDSETEFDGYELLLNKEMLRGKEI